MRAVKNIDKYVVKGFCTLGEGVYSYGNMVYRWQDMKIMFFHVQSLFCLIFQIKLKKVSFYLFSICVFVYLCIEFKSVT